MDVSGFETLSVKVVLDFWDVQYAHCDECGMYRLIVFVLQSVLVRIRC